ncbi:MAG: pyridoxamine 5'-phosphate oxidase family protein [Bacillota bacterium]
MSLKEIIEFANQNPVCYVATAEGDQPRVRGFSMWFADETGFYFQTGTPKRIYEQLMKNPKIEVCFYAQGPSPGPGKMLRVSGTVEFINDIDLKKRVMSERPFLKAMGYDYDSLVIFRISRGEAYFWTRENSLKEKEIQTVKF